MRLLLEPLHARRPGEAEHGLEIDDDVLGQDGERVALGDLELEADEALVEPADLLDVEAPVPQPLPAEHEEPIEHAVHDRVAHAREVDRLAHGPSRAPRAPLEERVRVGIEERAATPREDHVAGAASVVEEPEEADDPRPGAVPIVAGVLAAGTVGFELREEARQRPRLGVILRVEGQEAALLGMEHEDHPHEHGDQALVDRLEVVAAVAIEDSAAGDPIGLLEAGRELAERQEPLLAQPRAHGVLVLAGRLGLLEHGGGDDQPLGLRHPDALAVQAFVLVHR